jgi:hypothetical protein
MVSNSDVQSDDVSRKLNVLIALSVRQLLGDKDFAKGKRKQGVGEIVHFLADMGLGANDIASIVGSPITSVRTLLTQEIARWRGKSSIKSSWQKSLRQKASRRNTSAKW